MFDKMFELRLLGQPHWIVAKKVGACMQANSLTGKALRLTACKLTGRA